MRISVVTTTHNRPRCLELLELWLARQTVQPWEWLVIDDGTDHYLPRHHATVHLRDFAGEITDSFRGNWLHALDRIHGDMVIVMEDDDWYHPRYIETMVALLGPGDLAGLAGEAIYHPRMQRWMTMCNGDNASLASTVWPSRVSPVLGAHVAAIDTVYQDCYLWCAAYARQWDYRLTLNRADDGRSLHVGLKGLPGAKGLGHYHDGQFGLPDPGGRILERWVGRMDAALIRDLLAPVS